MLLSLTNIYVVVGFKISKNTLLIHVFLFRKMYSLVKRDLIVEQQMSILFSGQPTRRRRGSTNRWRQGGDTCGRHRGRGRGRRSFDCRYRCGSGAPTSEVNISVCVSATLFPFSGISLHL